MKKILILLLSLVLILGVFIACNKDGGKDTETGKDTSATTNPETAAGTSDESETAAGTSGESETNGNVETDAPATLADALAILKNLYKNVNEVTERDYDLVAQVKVGSTIFAVTWTSDKSEITIKESTKKGFWTVDLPDSTAEELAYVLTATITDGDGKTETYTINRRIPVIDNSGLVTEPVADVAYRLFMKQASLGQTVYMTTEASGSKYLKSTNDPKAAAEFFAEVVDGGFKFYTMSSGSKLYLNATAEKNDAGKFNKVLNLAAESTCVWSYTANVNAWMTTIGDQAFVVGSYGDYSTFCISEASYINADNTGVSQFPLGIYTKEYADAQAPDKVPDLPTTVTPLKDFIAIADKLANQASTPEKYIVVGKIVEIVKTDYGNLYIEDEEGNRLYVYGTYSSDGSARYDKMDPQPKVGDTIKIMGVASQYNGSQMKNGWVLELTPGEGGGETPDIPSVPAGTPVKPEVGKTYKLSFVQKNLNNATYYLTGVLDGYYMGSSLKASDGADFAIEATDGGYYLFCTVGGAKKYVNVVKSGNYTNAKFEDTASTVFTFDETLMTVVATISDGSYILGTKADGSYTTLGPMKSDSGCMYAQFVVSGADADIPDTPDDPDENGSVSDLQEGTAYKLYLTQVTNSKVLYMTSEISGGKFVVGSEDATTGLDFYAEKVEGGYKFYVTIDGAKKYLDAHLEPKDDGKTSKFLGFTDSTTNVWYYKADVNAWFVTLDGGEYVLGTYGSYDTFSISEARYITATNSGVSQFPGNFVLKSEAGSTPSKPDDKPAVSVSDVKVDTPYYIEGQDGNGALYFDGTIENGRINAARNAASAKAITLEAGAAAGEYYIYFMDGSTKTYLAVDPDSSSKTAAFAFSTEKNDNCVWLISTEDQGIFSKSFSNRGIGTKTAETRYNNFSSYSGSNLGSDEYDFAWFTAVKA